MITDMMPNFELFQPARIEDALALLDRHDKNAWKLAGGNDSFDWFKDRIKRPKVVIDLTGITELKGIRQKSDGILSFGKSTVCWPMQPGRLPAHRSEIRAPLAETLLRTPVAGITGMVFTVIAQEEIPVTL